MERVALGGPDGTRFGEDLGNVIELGDLNDDIGLGSSSSRGGGGIRFATEEPSRTVNINTYAPPSSSISGGLGGGIDITPLEPIQPITLEAEPISMDSFGAPSNGGGPSISFVKEPSSSPFGNAQSATGPGIHLTSSRDPEAEKKEKGDYINKLQRLEQKGYPVSRKFTMDNSLDEIKTEYFRLVDARQLEMSIKFQRQMLIGAVTGMEWLNGRFDPFDLQLEGWSETVHENVEDFDEIFEELYDKYKDKGKMSPEIQLVMKLAGSGFMCHVSNTFFRSKMPSMDDVLRKNPELARQMAAAAAQQAGPGFGNFMSASLGVQQPSFPGNGGPIGPNPSGGVETPITQAGGFFAASGAPPVAPRTPMAPPPAAMGGASTARREMSGPNGSGVEDILRTFEEVRRAEMTQASMPAVAPMSAGPAVAGVMSGAVSVHSMDDIMSQAESTRTGATGATGRRRRRAQPPPLNGNTLSLNV